MGWCHSCNDSGYTTTTTWLELRSHILFFGSKKHKYLGSYCVDIYADGFFLCTNVELVSTILVPGDAESKKHNRHDRILLTNTALALASHL